MQKPEIKIKVNYTTARLKNQEIKKNIGKIAKPHFENP